MWNLPTLLLFLFIVPGLSFGAGSASEPLRLGKEALAQGNLSEAEKWFGITARDFPKSAEGNEALVHQTLLLTSKELGSLRLASLWNEGESLTRMEKGTTSAHQRKAKEYEERALASLASIRKLIPALLSAKSLSMSLQFDLNTEGLDVEDLRSRLTKGELLDETESEKLEKGERLTNYLGLLGTLLGLSDDKLFENPHVGTVQPAALFAAVGSRLFIADQTHPNAGQREQARACFEKVLSLTADTPYDKQRMDAMEFIQKIDAKSPKKSAASLRCPVDGKVMDPTWNYCPIHGAKLKGGKASKKK